MKTNYQTFSKYLRCIAAMLLLLSGCKKGWLEEKSDKNLTVPLTLTEFQGLLDYTFTTTVNFPGLGEAGSDGHYITDTYFQTLDPAYQQEAKDAYIWSKTGRHGSSIPGWDNNYEKILTDNVILDGLNKINPKPLEQELWRDIKGQALLHRARVFFDLAQVYAQSFDPLGSNEGLGIVMRLSTDITSPSKRSTIKETYEKILKDLNEAKELLPARPKILTRGSAAAANAMLARVYLSMGDYVNAFTAADNCLKQYGVLLDYNDISINNISIGLYNKEVIWHTGFFPGFGDYSWFIDAEWVALFETNDLRKTRFFRINADKSISFKGGYVNAGLFFNGLATDEIYLTRAECYARAGKTTEALNDLNTLMIKRWDKNVTFVPYVAANADQALQLILTERRKELLFRGIRWMDLKRLNREPRFAVTLTRTVLGTTYTLEPNSYKYALPIPDNIIDVTGIPQNPGWQQ